MSETMIPADLILIDESRTPEQLLREVPYETLLASQQFWEARLDRLFETKKYDIEDHDCCSPEEDLLETLDYIIYDDDYFIDKHLWCEKSREEILSLAPSTHSL
ncbi:MAG: hypothetical protein CL438_06785 [Acidimicrobiaceae bacterium]|nr:hypothetical protein [Acidimicrobiaceae bacterium]|tara:strand:- start:1558 stop:1869 length:312 start_codon:yes stop_codon:yes gene_type:complete